MIFDYGLSNALAYKHDFKQDFQDEAKIAELQQKARQDAETKSMLLGDKLKMPAVGLNDFDDARVKENTDKVMPAVGKYLAENPDFLSNPVKYATFNTMADSLLNNEPVMTGQRIKQNRVAMVKDMQDNKIDLDHDEDYKALEQQYQNYNKFGDTGEIITHPNGTKTVENVDAAKHREFIYKNPAQNFDLAAAIHENNLGMGTSKVTPYETGQFRESGDEDFRKNTEKFIANDKYNRPTRMIFNSYTPEKQALFAQNTKSNPTNPNYVNPDPYWNFLNQLVRSEPAKSNYEKTQFDPYSNPYLKYKAMNEFGIGGGKNNPDLLGNDINKAAELSGKNHINDGVQVPPTIEKLVTKDKNIPLSGAVYFSPDGNSKPIISSTGDYVINPKENNFATFNHKIKFVHDGNGGGIAYTGINITMPTDEFNAKFFPDVDLLKKSEIPKTGITNPFSTKHINPTIANEYGIKYDSNGDMMSMTQWIPLGTDEDSHKFYNNASGGKYRMVETKQPTSAPIQDKVTPEVKSYTRAELKALSPSYTDDVIDNAVKSGKIKLK